MERLQYNIALMLLQKEYKITVSLVKKIQKQYRTSEKITSFSCHKSKTVSNKLKLSLSPYIINSN